MSVYRNQFLHTKVIDPILNNKNRCVFRLPAEVCVKKSLSLGGLGVEMGPTPPYFLTEIGGITNLIKSISLRVGGTQIDFNNHVSDTCVLENLRSTSTKANGVDSVTKYNRLDFKNTITTIEKPPGEAVTRIKSVAQLPTPVTLDLDGKIFLYELLQFFNGNHNIEGISNELLPLNIFKNVGNIELQIEWQTNPLILVNDAAATFVNVNTPTLLMECLDTSSNLYNVMSQIKTPIAINFNRLEQETINYPASVANVPLIIRERLNQPVGKYVKRMCVLNVASTSTTDLGSSKSTASYHETYQFNINGKQVIDYRSENSAEKVMNFCNAWGDYLCPVGGRNPLNTNSKFITTQDAVLRDQLDGNTSLFGLNVNQRIESMELDYSHVHTGIIVPGRLSLLYETDNIVGVLNDILTVSF